MYVAMTSIIWTLDPSSTSPSDDIIAKATFSSSTS